MLEEDTTVHIGGLPFLVLKNTVIWGRKENYRLALSQLSTSLTKPVPAFKQEVSAIGFLSSVSEENEHRTHAKRLTCVLEGAGYEVLSFYEEYALENKKKHNQYPIRLIVSPVEKEKKCT